MPRFDRTYRLLVGDPGAMGDEIVPPVHITFEVVKTAKESSNSARIRIWNLAKSTRQAYEEPDKVAILHAGYAEENGALLLCAGNILDAWSKRDKGDIVTELTLGDGYVPMRDTAVTLSYGAGAKSGAIIKDIAGQMGLSLLMADGVNQRSWAHGFSFFGAATTALHKVVRGTGLEWSIQNGTLQIVNTNGTTVKSAPVLNTDSGLIGNPQRRQQGAQEQARVKDQRTGDNVDVTSTRQERDGWTVKSLLLPSVEPADRVELESDTVAGWFRVDEIRHTGDYGGSTDWISELTLVAP